MARRHTGHMSGERYLGNTHMLEVHDLDMRTVRSTRSFVRVTTDRLTQRTVPIRQATTTAPIALAALSAKFSECELPPIANVAKYTLVKRSRAAIRARPGRSLSNESPRVFGNVALSEKRARFSRQLCQWPKTLAAGMEAA